MYRSWHHLAAVNCTSEKLWNETLYSDINISLLVGAAKRKYHGALTPPYTPLPSQCELLQKKEDGGWEEGEVGERNCMSRAWKQLNVAVQSLFHIWIADRLFDGLSIPCTECSDAPWSDILLPIFILAAFLASSQVFSFLAPKLKNFQPTLSWLSGVSTVCFPSNSLQLLFNNYWDTCTKRVCMCFLNSLPKAQHTTDGLHLVFVGSAVL